MNKHMNDDLLIKYLVGDATDEEKVVVTQWLAESEDNQKKYSDFRLIWEASEKLAINSKVDENLAWDRFKEMVPNEPVKSSPSWFKIAASIVLVSIGIWAVFFVYNRSAMSHVLVQTGNNTLIDTLSDGSVITLNRNTKIQYPTHFAEDHRTVKLLEGEAFFQVTPDSSKPFHVSVNDVNVSVIGTSFNIKNDDGETELIVETGVVEVSRKHIVIRLKRDEMVRINQSSEEFDKKVVSDGLYKYYRSNEFIADGTPLYRMIDVLNEVYGVHIVLENQELENLELNTTLKYNTSIRSNLNIICQTFDIKMKKNGEQIVLYK